MWRFLTELNKAGTTIILTTHYLEEAESLCRNLAIIGQGEIIAQGPTKELLKDKDRSSFVADLSTPAKVLPEEMSRFDAHILDDGGLEFSLKKGESLNEVLNIATEFGLVFISIRPKTNRLEELFVDLTEHQKEEQH
jgi:ABC-2 type transport system ATP-binding protein